MAIGMKKNCFGKLNALILVVILILALAAGGFAGSQAAYAADDYFYVVASGAYSGTVNEGDVLDITLQKSASAQIISLLGAVTDPDKPNLALNVWTASGPDFSWGFQESFTAYTITVPANVTGSMTVTVSAYNNSARKLIINLTVGSLIGETGPGNGVDGRILPAIKAGDTSDWIEIARNGGYSLIVRKSFVNVSSSGFNDNTRQSISYGTSDAYVTSFVRNYINNWFNGASSVQSLPSDARLRSFTVSHNALSKIGSGQLNESLLDGFSTPTGVKAGTGNDVVFALSFGEVSHFCSLAHMIVNLNTYPSGVEYRLSSKIAEANFRKLANLTSFYYGMWLRSPSYLPFIKNYSGPECASALMISGFYEPPVNTGSIGRAQAFALVTRPDQPWFGLVYPAAWVDSDVFN